MAIFAVFGLTKVTFLDFPVTLGICYCHSVLVEIQPITLELNQFIFLHVTSELQIRKICTSLFTFSNFSGSFGVPASIRENLRLEHMYFQRGMFRAKAIKKD